MTASEAPLAGVRVDRRVMRLAALFVQPDGCYAGLPDVDAWPEARDARRYTGPLPEDVKLVQVGPCACSDHECGECMKPDEDPAQTRLDEMVLREKS